MSEGLDALLNQPPPRPTSTVRPFLRAAVRGYRMVGGLIWGTCLLVPLLVGATSAEGEGLAVAFYGFLGCAVVLGIPTQVFVTRNVRNVRACLQQGVRIPARLVQVRKRGNQGQKVEEVEVAFTDPSGVPRRAFVTGVTTGAQPGTELTALVAPSRPTIIGLVLGDTIGIGRVAS